MEKASSSLSVSSGHEFSNERNFNKQEIEDFFGIDHLEMDKIISESKQHFNKGKEPTSLS